MSGKDGVRAAFRLFREPRLHVVPEVTFADGKTSASWEDYFATVTALFPHLYNRDHAGFPTDDAGGSLPRLSLRIEHEPEVRTVPFIVYPDGTVSESWEVFHREAAKQRPDLYARFGGSPPG